jgi:2-hydroxychromene-2-carboxylate isomerase
LNDGISQFPGDNSKMAEQLDYYLSLQSPWTWLGHDRLYEIAKRFGVKVNCRPVDFGAIFAQSGGLPLPKRAPQRQAYRLLELERWRSKTGVTLNMQPKHFPASEGLAAHVVTAVSKEGDDAGKLAGAILRAVWVEDRDIGDEATMTEIISSCGLNAKDLLARAGEPETEKIWQENTAQAIEAGVFGAPSYIFDGELFWGQDRLEFVEMKMAAR